MKLFLIWQDINTDYDTYDSAVVVAPDEESARHSLPANWVGGCEEQHWALPENVHVQYLGESEETLPRIVCASSNAG
jgi:hypothetical protein